MSVNNTLKIRLDRLDRRNKTQCQRNPPPLIHIPSGNQKTTSLAITPGALAKTKLSEFPDRITTTAGSTAGIIFIRKSAIKQETMTVSPREDMKNSKGNVSANARRIEGSAETFRKNLNTQPITYSKKPHLPTSNATEQTQIMLTSQPKIETPTIHIPASTKANSFNSKCKMIYSYNIKQGPDNRINVKETKTFGKPYDFCNPTSMLLDHLSDNQADQSITLHKGFQDTAKSNILIPKHSIKTEEACSSTTNYQSNLTNNTDNNYSKKTLADSGNKLKLKRNNVKKKPLSNIKVRNDDLDLSCIKEEPSLENENNFFSSWTMNKKMETSCRDFSYGETINNISTNILPSLDRENRETNSLIRGLYMADDDDDDDDIFFKQKCSNKQETKISNVLISDTQPHNTNISKDDRVIKPKKKSAKRCSRKRTTAGKVEKPSPVSDPNLLVRSMFMADEFCDNDKKRDHVPLFFGDDSILDSFSESNQGGIPDEKPKLTYTCYADVSDKKDSSAIGKKKDYLSAFFGSDSSPDVYELNVNEPSITKMDKGKRRFGCFSDKKESTIARKRTFSTCSRSSVTSQTDTQNSNVRAFAVCQFKANTLDSRPLTMLTTDEHYHTNMNAPPPHVAPSDNSAFLEVPSWRILEDTNQTKEDSSEDLECLDDSIFIKRHTKMEIDEKRIKRRDYQRLKEQELLKKLKERQEKTSFSTKKFITQKLKPTSSVSSLWPSIDDAQFIQVEDTIPVAAFGEFIPNFGKRAFSLPWLRHEEPKRSSRSKKKLKRQERD